MNFSEPPVYGLDIGTRSVVGTVGFMRNGTFCVAAQKAVEHDTRAMVDGQIHDIHAVASTIRVVTEALREETGQPLNDVCIAAAGRVLKTVTIHVDEEFEEERAVSREDIYALESKGIEEAYNQFNVTKGQGKKDGKDQPEKKDDRQIPASSFYCVGYSVVRYFLNGYPMGNLEEHNARTIGCDLIGTFLPDDVVDGLYKAVGEAGLQVVNLTLEPIAAIGLAIPDMYRMLNLALVDVGAGTSDISITKDGAIVAYGMIPMAGDALTEAVLQRCLTDFNTAEIIKRKASGKADISYVDIMGLNQTISVKEVADTVRPVIDRETSLVANRIRELNGGKSVSAVFVVGGGGMFPGYTEALSKKLGIKSERVAVRGKEVMQKVRFLNSDSTPDSLLVTPLGIALSYYEKSNSFIFVTFNGRRIKLYDNNKLEVLDCALQGEFPNDQLFPKRGNALLYTVNGVQRMTRGESGESAVITVNGSAADIHTRIQSNDIIVVKPGTAGPDAVQEVGALPEFARPMKITVNGSKLELPKIPVVNGEEQPFYYQIKAGDDIEVRNFYTIDSLSRALDVYISAGEPIYINDEEAEFESEVHDGDQVAWTLATLSFGPSEGKSVDEIRNSEELKPDAPQSGDGEETAEEKPVQTEPAEGADKDPSQAVPDDGGSDGSGNAVPVNPEVRPDKAGNVPFNVFADPGKKPAPAENVHGGSEKQDHTPPGTVKEEAPSAPEPQGIPDTADLQAEAASIPEVNSRHGEVRKHEFRPGTGTPTDLNVIVNGKPVTLTGRSEYMFANIFDYIDVDVRSMHGTSLTTIVNGREAEFLEPLKEGDNIEVRWNK